MNLQELCELGQAQLVEMDYLSAEGTLSKAEEIAWEGRDFDSLSRLYMPLQEARRQIRQRCGEGTIRMDLLASGPEDRMEGSVIAEKYPHGQLLVGGWGSLGPAVGLRQFARQKRLYLEAFLAAVYLIAPHRAVVIAPLAQSSLPDARPRGIDALLAAVPLHCVVLHEQELSDVKTYSDVMGIWERLHSPYMAMADSMSADPLRQIAGYRLAIQVDNACELAHQKISDVARRLVRAH